jgi:hypothetical protein
VNVKVVVAILLIVGVPVCAQAQSTPRASKADAQRVVEIISSDKAKTQVYCDLQDLGEQMERAYEERNIKLADELLQKIDTMGKTLGPEYVALKKTSSVRRSCLNSQHSTGCVQGNFPKTRQGT